LLETIAAQEGPFQPEVIAIDSGSSDDTLERLKQHGARILRVASTEFNHGETRNEALKHADGEYAVLLVQDAVPASTRWLSALIEPLLLDRSIAGSFARQLPDRRASRVTAHYLSRWIAAHEDPRVIGPPTAEDLQWARDVLVAGFKVAYVPQAVVRHSHERSIAYELQRTYLVHQRLETIFGL